MEGLISPSRYNLPPVFGYKNHDISKTCSPAYTIGNRPYLMQSETTPGPTAYETEKGFGVTLPKAPTYTIGQRYKRKIRYRAPAPNQYNLQGYAPGIHTPAFSFDAVARTSKRGHKSNQFKRNKHK